LKPRKLKHPKPWLAWIPFANGALILQLGGFHWALIFLILVPILGWIALAVLSIIATWRIFEKRKHPGWFSLAQIIPKIGGILYLVVIGIVAWQDKPEAKKPSKKKK
jgi:arginine exporter protein ArgO